MPMMRQGPKADWEGKDRKIGRIREKQRTGAATLLIHILAKEATNMLTNNTLEGRVPAFDNIKEAIALAIPYLLSASAIEKPPKSNMITGDNMEAKTAFEASMALSL